MQQIQQREKEHMELSKKLATECMVLLENDGTLPLKNCKTVALFGNGARGYVKGGTGSGDVNTRFNVNVEQGFINAGYQVVTEGWLDKQDENVRNAKAAYAAQIKEEAAKKGVPEFTVTFDMPYVDPEHSLIEDDDLKPADVAVYVISRNSGEGADRFNRAGDYLLGDNELKNIQLVASKYEKTVIVLNIGGVMDLSKINALDGINAVLLMSQLGNLGGDALLEVLDGKVSPSGKTTDTWAKSYMDYPSSAKFSHNESVHDEMYEDGIYVGYRYFDSFGVEPEYHFGYGLSYTDFEILTKSLAVEGNQVKLAVEAKNIGDTYSGKEVVQVYYSAPSVKLHKPAKELVAFKKSELLAPGQAQTLEIEFALEDMACYDSEKACWVLEKGNYGILVGNCSNSTKPAGCIEAEETITIEQCKNLFALDVELKELEAKPRLEESAGAVIKVNGTNVKGSKVCYQSERKELVTDKTNQITMADVINGKASVEELVAQLSVEEMAQLCVGTLRQGEGSIVGNASYIVPGAAGDTSSVCKENRGIKNLILADGPAGLRLQPHYKTLKSDGTLVKGGDVFGDNVQPFDPSVKDEDTIDHYQWCTAIPIGWALAQSFNVDLVQQAGEMVGKEMEIFDIDIWLAPALNIHRNPLCGRNFEYYSEDPLVAGKMAAAMTKGVQSHEGKGTCIKHFAANNQEDNRYFVNAHISERALREIYLKGFEIAVKESQPLSVMTSYNLLNGIHTANRYDLIQSALRDEWGFEGTVMTDWFTSQDMPILTGKFEAKYPISASTGCIFAGNDIQMPGCQKNVDDIVKAVNSNEQLDGYTITKADLQFNTANIIRVVAKAMKSC